MLIVGQSGSPTGGARVVENILGLLAGAFDVHHFGPDCSAVPDARVLTLHANPWPYDVYGTKQLRFLIESVRPEIVVLFRNPWQIPIYLRALADLRSSFKLIAHCALDGRLLRPDPLAWVPYVDQLVVPSQFGRAVVESSMRMLRAKRPSLEWPPIVVIPHAIDTEQFFPDDRPTGAWPNGQEVSKDSFVVLNAGRNQPRKRLDLTIAGFARFARSRARTPSASRGRLSNSGPQNLDFDLVT